MAFLGGIAPVLSAVGSIFTGIMGFASSNYQAAVADMNEKIAKSNAARAIERTQVEQQEQDSAALALLGQQEAAQGASGLTLTGGSAQRTRRTARILARKDALNIRQAGEIEKYNYLTDAANFNAQGQAAKLAGTGSLISGFFQAAPSLIGGSTSVYNPYRFTPRPIAKPGLVA
jgi:hypothetical protein